VALSRASLVTLSNDTVDPDWAVEPEFPDWRWSGAPWWLIPADHTENLGPLIGQLDQSSMKRLAVALRFWIDFW